jgi:hypothetical protein
MVPLMWLMLPVAFVVLAFEAAKELVVDNLFAAIEKEREEKYHPLQEWRNK